MRYKGQRLEFNTVGKSIGRGGNGLIFKIRHNDSGNLGEMVVKFLNSDPSKNNFNKRQERFSREVLMSKKLKAKYPFMDILPVIDYYLPELSAVNLKGKSWYVMPLAQPLDKTLIMSKETSIQDKIVFMKSIAETIKLLHSDDEKYAHRDIKPENILFYKEKFVLSDYGLIWNGDVDNRITDEFEKVGPRQTIAPEMRGYDGYLNDYRPADVYSFAKTLWLIITGNDYCFEGQYKRNDIFTLREKDYNNIPSLEKIHDLLEKATDNNKDNRPTISEIIELIDNWFKILNNNHLLQEEKSEIAYKKIKETKNAKVRVYVDTNDIRDILSEYKDICYIESKGFGIIEVVNILNSEKNNFLELTSTVNKKTKSYIIKTEKLEIIDDKLPILYTSPFDSVDFDNEKYEDPQKVFVPSLGDKKITLRNQDKFEFRIKKNE